MFTLERAFDPSPTMSLPPASPSQTTSQTYIQSSLCTHGVSTPNMCLSKIGNCSSPPFCAHPPPFCKKHVHFSLPFLLCAYHKSYSPLPTPFSLLPCQMFFDSPPIPPISLVHPPSISTVPSSKTQLTGSLDFSFLPNLHIDQHSPDPAGPFPQALSTKFFLLGAFAIRVPPPGGPSLLKGLL